MTSQTIIKQLSEDSAKTLGANLAQNDRLRSATYANAWRGCLLGFDESPTKHSALPSDNFIKPYKITPSEIQRIAEVVSCFLVGTV